MIENIKEKETRLNDKINQFREKQAMKKFFNDLIKMHKVKQDLKNKEIMRKYLIKWKNVVDDMNKRKKIIEKLKR